MFGFQSFGGAFSNQFKTQYRCFSVGMKEGIFRDDVEKGGKIIMPPSALDTLSRLHIEYPMLFKLTNRNKNRTTHCGVLEFVAEEGKVYLPHWMMENLLLEQGDFVNIQCEANGLPVATYSKFQPQSVDFLDISNPKAVLENILRGFACLTKGDMVAIKYNDKVYELQVLETKPSDAVSIIECDMSVEFAAPVGYVEPQRQIKPKEHDHEDMQVDDTDYSQYVDANIFRAFQGKGHRLDGKKKNVEYKPVVDSKDIPKRGIPNYEYKRGTLTFIRRIRPPASNGVSTDEADSFEPFKGSGQKLRQKQR